MIPPSKLFSSKSNNFHPNIFSCQNFGALVINLKKIQIQTAVFCLLYSREISIFRCRERLCVFLQKDSSSQQSHHQWATICLRLTSSPTTHTHTPGTHQQSGHLTGCPETLQDNFHLHICLSLFNGVRVALITEREKPDWRQTCRNDGSSGEGRHLRGHAYWWTHTHYDIPQLWCNHTKENPWSTS